MAHRDSPPSSPDPPPPMMPDLSPPRQRALSTTSKMLMAAEQYRELFPKGFSGSRVRGQSEVHRATFEQRENEFITKQLASWLSNVTGEPIAAHELGAKLETGVLLCELMQRIEGAGVTSFGRTAARGSFQAMENINVVFFQACLNVGIRKTDTFTEQQLRARQYKPVWNCLFRISRLAPALVLAPPMDELPEELSQGRANHAFEEEHKEEGERRVSTVGKEMDAGWPWVWFGLWWALALAVLLGLLYGILSKNVPVDPAAGTVVGAHKENRLFVATLVTFVVVIVCELPVSVWFRVRSVSAQSFFHVVALAFDGACAIASFVVIIVHLRRTCGTCLLGALCVLLIRFFGCFVHLLLWRCYVEKANKVPLSSMSVTGNYNSIGTTPDR